MSDYPSGYSGYKPSMMHQVQHRNTEFEAKYGHVRMEKNESAASQQERWAYPSFQEQLKGIPIWCKNHKGGSDDLKYCEFEGVARYPYGTFQASVPAPHHE